MKAFCVWRELNIYDIYTCLIQRLFTTTKHRSPDGHWWHQVGTWTESIPESCSCDVSSVGKTKLCPSASPLGESWLGQTCNRGREQTWVLCSWAESSSNEPASHFSKVESVRFGFTTFHKRFNPDSFTCFWKLEIDKIFSFLICFS